MGSEEVQAGTTIGGRFVVEAAIGRGGMASVYRARDLVSGRAVALKRLRPRDEAQAQRRTREMFEREYLTLVQLAHPRIVNAVDYGLDGELPYYTMELLDGGDLNERAPLDFRVACAVARDICSALSLVHSRRMVYRDLSPRNVRCTADGQAKLIDFGAMVPMGPAQLTVCTPAVASPEVVYRQPLDARSDLYALGATLYNTLVGRAPYPARSFQQLIDLWQQPLIAPSSFEPSVPPALDALVLELLQLEPQLRPGSAAEVSQRLCAIADLPRDEHLLVSQAYLNTPVLVGREQPIEVVSKWIARAGRKERGASLLVRGAPGVGRSRYLDACSIAAKLAGMAVVRASASDASSSPYGAVIALVTQLLELMPEETAAAAQAHPDVLCALVPALRGKIADTNERPPDLELQGKPALRSLLLALAKSRPLFIAVDDIELCDQESRALFALLADRTRGASLIVIATTARTAADDADTERMLAECGMAFSLAPLDFEQTRALLTSIFGDVPNLSLLVRRAHAVAHGNPRHLLRIAQHLVDRGVARFHDGAWALPDRIQAADLPTSIAQALSDAVAALDPNARALAAAFAQCPDERLSFDDCLLLSAVSDRAAVFRSLDQLLSAGVLNTSSEHYALASRDWLAPLAGAEDPELHARIARMFEQRNEGIRAARHFFRAGREREGVEVLVRYADESQRLTNVNPELYLRLLTTLPQDWQAVCEQGLSLAQRLGRSRRDVYALYVRMAGIFSQFDACSDGAFARLTHAFASDVGLDVYAALDPALPAGARLQQALATAAARYAATPEHERGHDPKTAITMLVRAVITCVGNFSRTLDVAEWRQLPSLAPLAPLSPAVAVTERLVQGFDARLAGRFEQACAIYHDIWAMLANGDAGLEPTFADSVRSAMPGIIGYMEAVLGLPSAMRCADEVAKSPLYHGSALAIRMLDKLFQGDAAGADTLLRERELWRLEQSRGQVSDVLTVLWALQAHAASDDLTRVRQCMEAIERTATKVRTWQPIAAWARGEYERIRGDHPAALHALDRALQGLPAGEHQCWALAAGARLKVLCEQQRYEQARQDGQGYLAIAQAHELGYVASQIRMPLALALAKLGDAHGAWALVRSTIDGFVALGARGVNLGLAYENAARVALALGQEDELERFSALCKETFLARPNSALAAKYHRLARAKRRAEQHAADAVAMETLSSSLERSELASVLQHCNDRQERLRGALSLLVSRSGAERGFLYTSAAGAPALCASSDDGPPPSELEELAARYLHLELARGEGDATETVDDDALTQTAQWTTKEGGCHRPVLLSHQGPDGYVVAGLAVLTFPAGHVPRPVAHVVTEISRLAVERGDLTAVTIGL